MSNNYKKLIQCSPEQMEEFILSLVRKPVSSYVDWSNWLRSDDPSPTYIGEPAFHNEDGEEQECRFLEETEIDGKAMRTYYRFNEDGSIVKKTVPAVNVRRAREEDYPIDFAELDEPEILVSAAAETVDDEDVTEEIPIIPETEIQEENLTEEISLELPQEAVPEEIIIEETFDAEPEEPAEIQIEAEPEEPAEIKFEAEAEEPAEIKTDAEPSVQEETTDIDLEALMESSMSEITEMANNDVYIPDLSLEDTPAPETADVDEFLDEIKEAAPAPDPEDMELPTIVFTGIIDGKERFES